MSYLRKHCKVAIQLLSGYNKQFLPETCSYSYYLNVVERKAQNLPSNGSRVGVKYRCFNVVKYNTWVNVRYFIPTLPVEFTLTAVVACVSYIKVFLCESSGTKEEEGMLAI